LASNTPPNSLNTDASPVLEVLRAELPSASILDLHGTDMPTIGIERADLLTISRTLRDHPSLQFALLVDITAADFHPETPRFEVVYHFACLGAAYSTGTAVPARRLRMKAQVPAEDARVASLTPLFPAANWLEREIFDLFGLTFDHHPDLRRILTPEDWEGHPLRKDYPVQIRKDAEAWSPIQLSVEEFAANIRAERERATKSSEHAD
jgi:NADH-quinone oxidoreductase subunit C